MAMFHQLLLPSMASAKTLIFISLPHDLDEEEKQAKNHSSEQQPINEEHQLEMRTKGRPIEGTSCDDSTCHSPAYVPTIALKCMSSGDNC